MGVLVDLRSMRVGGGGLYMGVGVCCSGEGGRSVCREAVRWLSDACSACCRGMVRRQAKVGWRYLKFVVSLRKYVLAMGNGLEGYLPVCVSLTVYISEA